MTLASVEVIRGPGQEVGWAFMALLQELRQERVPAGEGERGPSEGPEENQCGL